MSKVRNSPLFLKVCRQRSHRLTAPVWRTWKEYQCQCPPESVPQRWWHRNKLLQQNKLSFCQSAGSHLDCVFSCVVEQDIISSYHRMSQEDSDRKVQMKTKQRCETVALCRWIRFFLYSGGWMYSINLMITKLWLCRNSDRMVALYQSSTSIHEQI